MPPLYLLTISLMMRKLTIISLLVCLVGLSKQHGMLYNPPSRSTAWRLGYDVPPNYTDNELNCGGYANQWQNNDGMCGECGDPYEVPVGSRPNQAGGTYATGTIVGTYNEGEMITVTIDITAMHWGWWEFRMCPVPNKDTAITHECLDQYLLELADGSTRYEIPDSDGPGEYDVQLKLPAGLVCDQCVLQWKWHCGNSWGADPDGTECVGCGPQEEFYGCADITIIGDGQTAGPTTTTESTTTTTGVESTTTTTTPPLPTPSPWPSEVPDVDCVYIGEGAPDPAYDEWCQQNCVHVPSNCPTEHCACSQNPVHE